MKVINADFKINGVKTPLVCNTDGTVYAVVHNSVHNVDGGINKPSIGEKIADVVSAKGGKNGITNVTVKFL